MTAKPLWSRRAILKSSVLLAAARQIACVEGRPLGTGPGGLEAESESGGSARSSQQRSSSLGYDAFECPDETRAYLLRLGNGDRQDRLASLLEAAGFRVETLPQDASPAELRGLIAIPSYVSADAAYGRYMERYASDLYAFVDAANVLLQLPQAADTEEAPPFLPTTHAARRGSIACEAVLAPIDEHTLLDGIAIDDGVVAWDPGTEELPAFVTHDGFEVALAEPDGKALLLQGAYGQGRFVLSALELDADRGTGPDADLLSTFFGNLLGHVQAVCHRSADAVQLASSSSVFTPGSSMLAVLPDTQVYSLRVPGLYHVQTSFLREHAARLDLKYVIHLGDIVNNNTRLEWERASAAMSLLHGVIPYALAPGNHDYGPSGDASTRDTLMNEYFAFAQSESMESFGGAYERGKLDNSYHLFSIKGRDFVLVALEWGPRDEVIEWANEVMLEHAGREGIFVTHAYLNNNDRRYDHRDTEHSQRFNPHEYATPGGVNDGEELWQKLVRHHRFSITLNGHVLGDGCGYLASKTDRGNTCHQMLSNYQMRDQGGEAYMRLLEFLDDGRTVRVHTYSPLYDRLLDEPGHNFTIELD